MPSRPPAIIHKDCIQPPAIPASRPLTAASRAAFAALSMMRYLV